MHPITSAVNRRPKPTAYSSGLHHTSLYSSELISIEVTKVHTYTNHLTALQFVSEYISQLKHCAQNRQAQNLMVLDQNFPVEVITMIPTTISKPPMAILGGMGPLAGAQAMEHALKKFGDTRQIVLLQLCCCPPRGLNEMVEEGEGYRNVVETLAAGLAKIMNYVIPQALGSIQFMVACNTAHFFIPAALQRVKHEETFQSNNLRFMSLMDSVVASLAGQSLPVLVLGTSVTQSSRLYTEPLAKNNISFVDLAAVEQELLVTAIYHGIKEFQPNVALEAGEVLFNRLWDSGLIPKEGVTVIAACTEVPEIIGLLETQGSQQTKDRIATFNIIDPVKITLDCIERQDW